jgi:hypothetical protein
MIHQYAIGWIVGSGRNKREARAHAEQLAAAALQQSPLIIRRYRGHTAVIYQIAGNWSYRIIAADDGDSRLIIDPDDVIPGADLAATEARAGNHLAQNGWRPQDGVAVPDIIQGEANRTAFQRWAQWQTAVANAESKTTAKAPVANGAVKAPVVQGAVVLTAPSPPAAKAPSAHKQVVPPAAQAAAQALYAPDKPAVNAPPLSYKNGDLVDAANAAEADTFRRFVAAKKRPPADRDELGGYYRQLNGVPTG